MIADAPWPRSRLYTSLGSYLAIAADVLSGRFASGSSVEDLETELARRIGARHAVAMPQARTGIHLLIKALVPPGRKVLLSPYTISEVINMVITAGARPVFVDIERESCDIDPAEVERLIDGDTGAVLVTHFYGLACDIERLRAICAARGVPLIEDCAQALGARVGGRSVGTFGRAGVFSFGMYKNVNSFFGGAVVTDDDALAATLRAEIAPLPVQPLVGFLIKVAAGLVTDILTWPPLFRLVTFWIFRFGYLNGVDALNNRVKTDMNPVLRRVMPGDYLCRLSATQARLVLRQLDGIEAAGRARMERARRYHEGLRDLNGIRLPPWRDDLSHVYWHYCIQVEDRGDLVRHAMRELRDIAESHHKNCADMACFAEYNRDCPNARVTAASVIYLPTYPSYPMAEVDRNIEVIRRYFRRAR
ncbi:MAG: hypothetical protein FJX47_15625 [Alphaproteobacteria bacterium]|nr:hypothetical protein [Alphaproteobacteria bacterium]